MMLKPTGTPLNKIKKSLPGQSRTHYAECPAYCSDDGRVLRGTRRTRHLSVYQNAVPLNEDENDEYPNAD